MQKNFEKYTKRLKMTDFLLFIIIYLLKKVYLFILLYSCLINYRTQEKTGPHGHIHLENNSEDTIGKLGWRQAQIPGETAVLKADGSKALGWEIHQDFPANCLDARNLGLSAS